MEIKEEEKIIKLDEIKSASSLCRASVRKGRYTALGHFIFFKSEENKYFSPYVYCIIYKSDLLNSNFVDKKNFFILFFW